MEAFKEFNHALKTFLRDLVARFPHVPELRLVLVSYKLLKTLGARRPIQVFDRMVGGEVGAQRVLERDEAYFTRADLDVDDVLSGFCAAVAREWRAIDADSKDAIWRHMQVLVVLARHALPCGEARAPLARPELHREASCRF
jgi:hypothetical protein